MRPWQITSFLLLLLFITIRALARERGLRVVPVTYENVDLVPGISCVTINTIITCYAVSANRSAIYFVNKTTKPAGPWSKWHMLVLEDPSYDNKLDGISCIARKNRSKCYLRLENVGFEYLIELNPLNLTWYQLCDHLATKPVTLLSNVNNINIFARTVKNELYHKYANDTWYVDTKNDYKIIGEVSCVTVNVDGTIICYVRTEQNEILIWNQADDSFQQLQTPNNTISFLTDLYCTSEYDDGITTVVCVATSTDYNVYGMLCHSNGIQCSSWILLSIKTKFQIQLRPLVFFYGNQKRHLGLYAVSTDSEPYICTCQNCTETTNNWNEIWSEWMLLTSVRPLQTLESTFINDQDKLAYIVAITQDDNMAYSTFDGQHHIPRPFLSLSNRVTSY